MKHSTYFVHKSRAVYFKSVNGPKIVWHEHPDASDLMHHSQIWKPIKKIT